MRSRRKFPEEQQRAPEKPVPGRARVVCFLDLFVLDLFHDRRCTSDHDRRYTADHEIDPEQIDPKNKQHEPDPEPASQEPVVVPQEIFSETSPEIIEGAKADLPEDQPVPSNIEQFPAKRLSLPLYQRLKALGIARVYELAKYGEERVCEALTMLESANRQGQVNAPGAWVVACLTKNWKPATTPVSKQAEALIAVTVQHRASCEALKQEAMDPVKVRRSHLARLAMRCSSHMPANMRKRPEDLKDDLVKVGLTFEDLLAYLAETGERDREIKNDTATTTIRARSQEATERGSMPHSWPRVKPTKSF